MHSLLLLGLLQAPLPRLMRWLHPPGGGVVTVLIKRNSVDPKLVDGWRHLHTPLALLQRGASGAGGPACASEGLWRSGRLPLQLPACIMCAGGGRNEINGALSRSSWRYRQGHHRRRRPPPPTSLGLDPRRLPPCGRRTLGSQSGACWVCERPGMRTRWHCQKWQTSA